MRPILLIHGYSSESKGDTVKDIRRIYGKLPAQLRSRFTGDVLELDVSRYISLEDGITVDDISRAMQRALETDYPHLLKKGFNVVIHSTGALVVRNWIRRYWDGKSRCPVHRVIHLAGANFGSGMAHIGGSQLAKWARFFQGSERGLRVLSALELGSNWTIEMHMEVDEKIRKAKAADRPLEFCMIGSQRPDEYSLVPVKYATEAGSDGVVRVAASNLNYSYVALKLDPKLDELDPKEVASLAKKGRSETPTSIKKAEPELHYVQGDPYSPRNVPFAVIHRCSHTYKASSILDGSQTRDQVLGLIEVALGTNYDTMQQAVAEFNNESDRTRELARRMRDGRYALVIGIDRQPQYDRFAQVVFRIRDQYGAPVPHFNIYFNSFGGGEEPERIINELFKDAHPNKRSKNTITFYLRICQWDEVKKDWRNRLDDIKGCVLEIDANEPGNPDIDYLPMRYELDTKTLKQWVLPDRTTIVDVQLSRIPSRKVFKIVRG